MAFKQETYRLEALFKQEALEECGISRHPKAQAAMDLAWSLGHAAGYLEVLQYLKELAELMT